MYLVSILVSDYLTWVRNILVTTADVGLSIPTPSGSFSYPVYIAHRDLLSRSTGSLVHAPFTNRAPTSWNSNNTPLHRQSQSVGSSLKCKNLGHINTTRVTYQSNLMKLSHRLLTHKYLVVWSFSAPDFSRPFFLILFAKHVGGEVSGFR